MKPDFPKIRLFISKVGFAKFRMRPCPFPLYSTPALGFRSSWLPGFLRGSR